MFKPNENVPKSKLYTNFNHDKTFKNSESNINIQHSFT